MSIVIYEMMIRHVNQRIVLILTNRYEATIRKTKIHVALSCNIFVTKCDLLFIFILLCFCVATVSRWIKIYITEIYFWWNEVDGKQVWNASARTCTHARTDGWTTRKHNASRPIYWMCWGIIILAFFAFKPLMASYKLTAIGRRQCFVYCLTTMRLIRIWILV